MFWASWGGSGKEPGSGNQFREPKVVPIPFDGFRQVPGSEGGSRFRWVPTGSGVLTGSGSESGCGFEGLEVPGFDGFLMGSDGFEGFGDFGFRWGSQGLREQERLAMLCGE